MTFCLTKHSRCLRDETRPRMQKNANFLRGGMEFLCELHVLDERRNVRKQWHFHLRLLQTRCAMLDRTDRIFFVPNFSLILCRLSKKFLEKVFLGINSRADKLASERLAFFHTRKCSFWFPLSQNFSLFRLSSLKSKELRKDVSFLDTLNEIRDKVT